MANKSGTNQFSGLGKERLYGDVGRQERLSRSAPISGAPVSAMNASKRAQRRAAKGRGQGEVAPPPPLPPEPTYNARLAEVWRMLSAQTDDPLIKEYAAKAEAQAQA